MMVENLCRSRALGLGVLVISASVLAACGGGSAGEPRGPQPGPAARGSEQQPAPQPGPTTQPGGERSTRDQFSLRSGEVCASFYAEAAPLQAQLQSLGPRVQNDRGAREQAEEIIDAIQAGSRQFLRSLESTTPPSSPTGRQDRKRLLASIEDFVGLQRDNLELVEGLLARPDRVSAADQRRVVELRRQLGAELAEQQALLRRLDVPECLPS